MLRSKFAIGLDLFFGLIFFFVSCGPGGRNANVRPARNITAIQHTVLIIKENHTFDNYFGTFPGADGATTGITSTGQVVPLVPMPDVYQAGLCNGWSCAIQAIDGGKVDKFDLISGALLNSSPNSPSIGRGQKVGKEEIIGMVKALECYLNEDHAALDKEWWRRLDAVSAEVARVPGVATSFNVPDVANHVPHMRIFWDPRKISLSPHDAASALRNGKPSIVLGSSEGGLGMNSFMLKPGEEKIIAAQLVQLFKSHTA